MKIGTIDLGERPVFLAPMEDVTDISFRLMCKRFGADMVYTEFVSADALIRSVNKTQQKLNVADEERPVAIQIYGRDVPTMVEAAQICEAAHPDILDINFGCPVKRVAGKGAGAGMLRNIPLMLDITREVVKAVNIPVTVKTRLGWDADNRIIGLAFIASNIECALFHIALHNRTHLVHIIEGHKLHFINGDIIVATDKTRRSTTRIIKHFGPRDFAAVSQHPIFADISKNIRFPGSFRGEFKQVYPLFHKRKKPR